VTSTRGRASCTQLRMVRKVTYSLGDGPHLFERRCTLPPAARPSICPDSSLSQQLRLRLRALCAFAVATAEASACRSETRSRLGAAPPL
jgi:hypothetical protein